MLRIARVVASLGAIIRLYSLTFLFPALIAVAYDRYDLRVWGVWMPSAVPIFLGMFVVSYWIGTGLRSITREASVDRLQDREAYIVVGIGWLALCILSMIPFMISHVILNPVDAFFETMSGLTTTGASVIAGDLEAVTPSIMMWRAFLQFLGGMGIIVLAVAVLARLSHGGMQLLQAEVPGPSINRIAPRLAHTARLLWTTYLGMAGALFAILFALIHRHGWGLKTTFYEALLHTFTTVSTGGFSNHNESIAYFHDPWIEVAVILFMLAAGTNFTLILLLGRKQWRPLFKDGEWRLYMLNFALITLLATGLLWRAGSTGILALRDAAFTVASITTSTGFATADYELWPGAVQFLLLFIMVAGGTAGSTAGGMKFVRILLLMKVVRRELTRLLHPNAVQHIRIAGKVVQPATIMTTVGFFFSFVTIWLVGTALLTGLDPIFANPVDAASASLSALSNIGPGLGVVGPTQNYAGISMGSKIILAAEMWAGRLEIFTALLLFSPETWKH